MVLVDTSVWISFFKGEEKSLHVKNLIIDNTVSIHPYIIGELLLGGLSENAHILLNSLHQLDLINHEHIYKFISKNKLSVSGIGWVDAAILASAKTADHNLLTYDGHLEFQAERFKYAYHYK